MKYILQMTNDGFHTYETTDEAALIDAQCVGASIHDTEKAAKAAGNAILLPLAQANALATIRHAATAARSKLVNGDPTKIGEYVIKDRIAGMTDRDTARLFADAEATARNVTPDELLATWAEKSLELAKALTSLAARVKFATSAVEASSTPADIRKIAEDFAAG